MSSEAMSGRSVRVLVLEDAAGTGAACVAALGPRVEARVVRTVDAAAEALRGEAFDLVVAGRSELLPLAAALDRERRHAVLEAIAQGVCIVDNEGRLLWANAALRAYPAEVGEAVREACAGLIAELAADPARPVRRRALSVEPPGQRYHFDLTASALPDGHGRIERVVGLVYDTTAVTRMREKLDAIDAAGRELVALDVDATARLELPERLRLLEDKVIHYCRELLNFTHFAVLVLEPQSGRLETVLMGGFPEQAKALNLRAAKEGNGISGYVAVTGQSYICPDVSRDPLYLAGFEQARSSLTVPLRLIDRVVGVLNVEADRPAAFTEEDRQVAEIFARYIAVALHTLKLLAAERTETTGEVTAGVRAELAEPLNDIIAEVTRLLQAGAAPEAAQRLRAIIDRVDAVKQRLQARAEAPGVLGLGPPAAEPDPLLRGKRVLVADDEDIIRETIADVLAKAGALTVMARDGDQAVSMIRTQHFDLVLSDIKMPCKNGYEVFAAARQAGRGCRVILITGFGYDPEHAILRASREGLAGVLFKPFRVEQLFEAIQKALAPAGG